VSPTSRQLACGDVGIGALAAPDTIGAAADDLLRRTASE
jgi:hypothetical protein